MRADWASARVAALWVLATKLVLVPLVFDPSALLPFAAPKAVLGHALALILGALLVVVATSERGRMTRPRALHAAVMAYVVIAVAATVLSLDPITAVFGSLDRMLGLLTVLDHAVLFAAIALIPRTERDARVLGAAFLAPTVVVLAYAALQRLRIDPVRWVSGDVERVFSTFGNATVLAQYLLVSGILVAAAAVLLEALAPRTRIGLAIWGALLVGAAVVTGTRAALVGLVLSALLLAVLAWIRDPTPQSRRTLGYGYAAGLVLLLALVVLTPIGGRIASVVASLRDTTTPAASADLSLSGRIVLYEVALAEVKERPLLGLGPDGYVLRFPANRPERSAITLGNTTQETSPHSWIAHVATGTGVLGLAAFVAVLVLGIFTALRAPGSAVALVACCALVAWIGDGLISVNNIGTDWLPWAALGAIAAGTSARAGAEQVEPATTSQKRGRRRRVASPPRRRGDWIPVAAVAIMLVVAYLLLAPILSASRHAEDARRARAVGNTPAALAASTSAVADDPRRAEYWHGLGLAQIAAGRVDDSLMSFGRAIELAPYHATYHGNLARAHLTLAAAGSRPAGERALEAARAGVQADPNSSYAHSTVALVLERLGRMPEGAVEADRSFALDIDPPGSEPYFTAARIYAAVGRDADAARVAELGARESERRLEPFARDLRFLLVETLVRLGRLPEALVEVNHIVSREPANARALRLRDDIVARIMGRE